jgi:hypothetical protein
MRAWIGLVLAVGTAQGAVADPVADGLAGIMGKCETTRLSLNMPRAPLSRVFATLEDLSEACGVRFDVAPDVAARTATLELKDVKLATVLDVLAGTHDLGYRADGPRVSVRAIPPADGFRAAMRRRAGSHGPILLRVVLVERGTSEPRIVVKTQQDIGSASEPCMTVHRPTGGAAAIKLDGDGKAVSQPSLPAGFFARLCPARITETSLELIGEAVVREISDEGHTSREERKVFTQTLARGDKELSLPDSPDNGILLFKSGDGAYELKLLGMQTVSAAP